MKKKFFSLGLYCEGLKQTRTVSILTSCLISIVSGFTIVIAWLNAIEHEKFYLAQMQPFTKTVLSGSSACGALIAAGLVAAPLMTYHLFQFQNKRNTSDFYHSLPHSRLCIFCSFMASVLTQLVADIVICSVFSLLLGAMASNYLTILVSPLVFYAISTLIIGMLVSATVALAMAITGTPFNNLILSGMILFLPRIMLFILKLVLASVMPNEVGEYFLPFCNMRLNMLTGVFAALFDLESINFSQQFANVGSILYTLLLSCIYFCLGAWCFHRRKSEAAGFSAPSHRMQAVYRTIIGSAITVVATLALYNSFVNGDRIVLSEFVIVWTVGIIAYFLYELITTKKWKNLISCIPGLAIVLVINLVSVGITHVVFRYELHFTPDADDIRNISIVSTGSERNYYNWAEYASLKSGEIAIHDQELIEKIANALKENVEYYDRNGYDSFRSRYNNWWDTDQTEKENPVTYTSQYFRIKTGTRTAYREIFFPDSWLEDIAKINEQEIEYRKIWMTLPQMIKETGYLYFTSFNEGYSFLPAFDNEALENIDSMLREEIRSCDFATWYGLLSSSTSPICEFQYQFMENNASCYLTVPIYQEIAPNTLKMILSYIYEQGNVPETFYSVLEMLRQDEKSETEPVYDTELIIEFPIGNIYLKDLQDARIDRIIEHLLPVTEFTQDTTLVMLTIYYNNLTDYETHQIKLLLPTDLTDEEIMNMIEQDKYPIVGEGDTMITKPVS